MYPIAASDDAAADPLLGDTGFDAEEQRRRGPTSSGAAISVPQLFGARELRRPLTIVCFSMLCQQLSGTFPDLMWIDGVVLTLGRQA